MQTPKGAHKSEIFEANSRKNLQIRQAPSTTGLDPEGIDNDLFPRFWYRCYCGKPASPALCIRDLAVAQGKKGVIPSAAHIGPGMNIRSPLTYQDGTGFNIASSENLDAQILGIGIPAIFRAASPLLRAIRVPPLYNYLTMTGKFLLNG